MRIYQVWYTGRNGKPAKVTCTSELEALMTRSVLMAEGHEVELKEVIPVTREELMHRAKEI